MFSSDLESHTPSWPCVQCRRARPQRVAPIGSGRRPRHVITRDITASLPLGEKGIAGAGQPAYSTPALCGCCLPKL